MPWLVHTICPSTTSSLFCLQAENPEPANSNQPWAWKGAKYTRYLKKKCWIAVVNLWIALLEKLLSSHNTCHGSVCFFIWEKERNTLSVRSHSWNTHINQIPQPNQIMRSLGLTELSQLELFGGLWTNMCSLFRAQHGVQRSEKDNSGFQPSEFFVLMPI